jgi:hypothetical protein
MVNLIGVFLITLGVIIAILSSGALLSQHSVVSTGELPSNPQMIAANNGVFWELVFFGIVVTIIGLISEYGV